MERKPKQHRAYTLETYNPKWAEGFEKRAEKLKTIFGDEAIDIQHVGSTSIPGIVAKPQIDILVVVKELSHVQSFSSALESAGFAYMGANYIPTEEYFVEDTPDGKRLASIHILEQGNPKINSYINFRDYLRVNEEDRALYVATKTALYQQHGDSYANYDAGKKEVLEAIKSRANQWAQERSQNI